MNVLRCATYKKVIPSLSKSYKYFTSNYLHTNANLLETAQGKDLTDTTGKKTNTSDLLKNRKVYSLLYIIF